MSLASRASVAPEASPADASSDVEPSASTAEASTQAVGRGELEEQPESVPSLDSIAHASETLSLEDGAYARREGPGLALRDPEGRLLLRYENGRLELCASDGDLVLKAAGAVKIESGTDTTLSASRDVRLEGTRAVSMRGNAAAEDGPALELRSKRAHLRAKEVAVDAPRTRVVSAQIEVFAKNVSATADSVKQRVEDYELTATRIVEKARDRFTEIAELTEQRLGRVRMLVQKTMTMRANRTVISSEGDTKVDGRKVLLG